MDNVAEIKGELIGSVRFCAHDTLYKELETYRKKDGSFYNVRYEECEDGDYRITIIESSVALVDLSATGKLSKTLVDALPGG